LNRPKNVLLGINVAGGSDMHQKLVYIHSITPGSLADKCNKFKVGDQIVMAGNTTMAGLTWKAASNKINKLVGTFKIVAKRKGINGSEQQQLDNADGSRPTKVIIQHQDPFDSDSRDKFLLQEEMSASAPEPPSSVPPEPTSNIPPEPPSSVPPEPPSSIPPEPPFGTPPKVTKQVHTVSMDSLNSESGNEFQLQVQELPSSIPHPKQNTKPARAISLDSFDSESDDELLLEQEETLGVPPKLPPTIPPEPLSNVVTKPAHAISLDSFDSESGGELLLEQEETLGTPPDPPSSALPDSTKKLAHAVSVDSFDSESGDEALLQKEMLDVPPKPSSAPPEPPPRVPPKSPKLFFATTAHQQNRSDSFESERGIPPNSTLQLSAAPQLSKDSINSEESGDESTSASQETFTVIFNKGVNTQLGISIKEDIDTTGGIGIRCIKKGSLAEQDGRLRPGNKLLSVNGISLCGMTYKKTLEVLRNAGNQVKIVATRPVARKSVTLQSSIDELSEVSDNEEPAEAMKVGEEKFTVDFHKEGNCKLGVTITGGIDTPTGDVGIKNIVKGSLADRDGRLQQGDKLLSVNGISLTNVTNKEALDVLRNAGDYISIVAVRYVGVDKLKGTPLSSAVPSLTSSQNQSPRSSRRVLHEAIPEIPTPHRKMSRHFQPGKRTTESTSSLHESGHHTLPRDFGTVKAVELRKGPQGLGIQLIGGADTKKPVTVKEVFQGGAAHQSKKIRKGDQILEVNGKSFAELTHREVIELIKNEPEGKVTLLVKFASRNK